jgi:CelD/BcsL family acetyltransferase involved in cellulose biosynthesis
MTESWLSLWFRGPQALAIGFLKIWTFPLDRFRPEHDPQPSPLAPATKTKVMAPQSLQLRDRKSAAVAKRRSKQPRKKVHLSRRSVGVTETRARVVKKGRR